MWFKLLVVDFPTKWQARPAQIGSDALGTFSARTNVTCICLFQGQVRPNRTRQTTSTQLTCSVLLLSVLDNLDLYPFFLEISVSVTD